MRYVSLGGSDLIISEFGFGCIPIIRLSRDEAVRVLRHAVDRGVNYFDTASAYRDSEEKIGDAFAGMRAKVVLSTKTLKRGAADATEQLEKSLRLLRTDHIDLYQLHQISQEQEWRQVTAPAGALEAVMKAKAAGKIRYVGVTSHNLRMALTMVKSGLFDSLQFPFNLIEEGAKDELFAECRDRGIGFIGMKPFGGGVIDNASLAFKYLRNHPGVIPIPGFESCQQLDEIISCYKQVNLITEQDQSLMENYRAGLGKIFCRRCEYCQPCPHGVMITPAMGYPIVAARMSPAVAVEFCKSAMESVLLCRECGECLDRCPYELSVIEILRTNYALYKADRERWGDLSSL